MALRILHLEDDARDASLVEATLAADGIAIRIVRVDTRDGFERALRSEAFDVILADYNLPQFDGLAAQTLAAQVRPDAPFIFLSGSIGEDVAVERLKAGATDYVLKDRMARLPSAVRRALAEAAERKQRREADAEIRRLNAELEARVIARTVALAEAEQAARASRVEAERANRSKSEFLSRMSHDLRTPLNAILGFAQLLELDATGEDMRESAAQILKGGQHLLALVNEVLDIARIEAGHLSLSPEPVNAPELVHQAVELVKPLAVARGITLHVDQAVTDVIIRADRPRLNQVLLNLLSNAVKYNRKGGRVTVGIHPIGGRRARITVTDTGAGIPAAKLALLFQPFERLGAEQTAIEGTGLGLALSRGLAEAMGGTLGVESEVDCGTTFWIELAVSDEPAAAPMAPSEVTTSQRTDVGGVVLYVEDNRSNVRLMERVLKRRPHVRLVHAPTGEDGIRLACSERPALIFLDLHLPDMAGEDVLRRLWENPTVRRIPVAILSADATPAHVRRMEASGAVAYLTKPLEIREVMRLIDDRLGAAHATTDASTAQEP